MLKHLKLAFVSIFLLIILLIAFLLHLLPLLVILGLILLQKVILDLLVFPSYLGIDISFFALILAAMIYGPIFGFILGLIVIPFLGIFRLTFIPATGESFSLTPSFGSIIVGLLGLLAGLMSGSFSFLTIVIVTVILKNFALTLQTWTTGGTRIAAGQIYIYVLNIITTIIIAFILEEKGIISFIMTFR